MFSFENESKFTIQSPEIYERESLKIENNRLGLLKYIIYENRHHKIKSYFFYFFTIIIALRVKIFRYL